MKIVRIDPDGTVTDVAGSDVLRAAEAELGQVTVVRCVAPWLNQGGPSIVGVLGEWSRTTGDPVNMKAWACYGRSPICGPMYLAHDTDEFGGRPDLDEAMLAGLRRPWTELVDAEVRKVMDQILIAEGLS